MSKELERKDIEPTTIDWDEHAGYWDDFDEAKDYSSKIFKLLTNQIDLKNLSILDFGCGTGLLTDYMREQAKRIVALDSSKKMIEVLHGKNYENVETLVGELNRKTVSENPALQEHFDLVVAASVCAFLPNYTEVLGIIKSLLKPQGMFVQWDWLRSEKDSDFGFTESMIQEAYDAVGLKVDSICIPFHMMENDEKMEVLMAVGKP